MDRKRPQADIAHVVLQAGVHLHDFAGLRVQPCGAFEFERILTAAKGKRRRRAPAGDLGKMNLHAGFHSPHLQHRSRN